MNGRSPKQWTWWQVRKTSQKLNTSLWYRNSCTQSLLSFWVEWESNASCYITKFKFKQIELRICIISSYYKFFVIRRWHIVQLKWDCMIYKHFTVFHIAKTQQFNYTNFMFISATYMFAWTPYSVICLWASFGDYHYIPSWCFTTLAFFAKTSFIINPYVYVGLNMTYR